MRTIKFRGKNKYGKWIKGDLIHNRGKVYIAPHGIQNPFAKPENFEVDELTVGQYTGFSDKNGVEIYVDDMLMFFDYELLVEYKYGMFGYSNALFGFIPFGINRNITFNPKYTDKNFKVIGNIHDDYD
jgi:hypothetical protein